MTIAEQIKAAKEQLKTLQSKIISKTFSNKLTAKVGDKGTVNIYGLNKQFPVCLYPNQIAKLAGLFQSAEFQQFLNENMATLEANSLAAKESKLSE